MRRVEVLVARDDYTWDTVVISVPSTLGTDREQIVSWIEQNQASQRCFRNAVLFAIYSFPEEH